METSSLPGLNLIERACLGVCTLRGWLVISGDYYYFTSSAKGATRFDLWNDIGRELKRLGLDHLKYRVLKIAE
jgi:hypothetical protein